jgi:hypothetical protein
MPFLRISTRRGMAPQALITGLLMVEADRVRRDAVAYSCKIEFCD